MIKLTKNATNIVVLTLLEKTTVTNPHYLFRLINDETKLSYTFIGIDNSAYKNRYNRFNIVEKSSPNNLNGEVLLPLTGFYSYEIYEQTSSTNLNYTLSTGIVEVGKVKLTGTATTTTAYDSQTKTNIVYNG